jgi:salicylate hydroxylase
MPSSKQGQIGMASVGIIGAGIGGLTAAIALRQKGFVVRVYEQASQFIPKAGAGFGFSPNGQVCLKSLGIETRNLIHPFDKLVHLSKEGTLKAESDILRQMRQRHGFGIGGCLRADLVDTLKESLDDKDSILQYSHKLVNMTQDDDRVCLQFENGKKQEHDFVIGADGIHSSVASILDIDQSPPIYSDANIFYGVIEKPDEALLKEIGLEPHALVQVSAMNVIP